MTIRKYIPDFITSMNLLSGTIGVVFAMEGRLDIAFPLMLAAAVFDFCDGLAARALDAYSDLGKELDSLSDLVSFGVLPSVMLYSLCGNCFFGHRWMCFIPLAIAVFSGIRLAKFNVDDRQHSSFLGLPTPACAMFCGSLAYFVASEPASVIAVWCFSKFFIPALTAVMCILLVCELPMFSLKFSKDDSKELKSKRIALVAACIIAAAFVIVAGLNWSLIILIILSAYIVLNLIFRVLSV